MLFAFVKRVYPHIYKHLVSIFSELTRVQMNVCDFFILWILQKKQKIEPILYMTEWFLCVYTRTLPWPTLLRVWDMFLCEGEQQFFQIAENSRRKY